MANQVEWVSEREGIRDLVGLACLAGLVFAALRWWLTTGARKRAPALPPDPRMAFARRVRLEIDRMVGPEVYRGTREQL